MASAMVWICQILTLRSLLTSPSSRTEWGSPVDISLCTFPFLNIFYLLWFSNPIPSTTQLADEVKLLESHRSLCKHKSDAVLCLRPAPWLLSDTDEQTAKFSNKQNVDSVTHLAATEYNEFSICSTCKQLGWCSFSLNRKPFYNVNSGQESRKESPLQRFANPPVEYGFKYNLYWPRQLNIWYMHVPIFDFTSLITLTVYPELPWQRKLPSWTMNPGKCKYITHTSLRSQPINTCYIRA